MKKSIIKFLFCLFMGTNLQIRPAVIIWDVGETLIKVDHSKAFWHFCSFDMPIYMLGYCFIKGVGFNGFAEHIKDLFLSTLTKIPSPFQGEGLGYEAIGIDGKVMPALQRDFLLGRVTSEEVIKTIEKWVKNNKNYFSGKIQRGIFRKNIRLYFDVLNNVKMQKYTKCIELLKQCYTAVDSQGNRVNKCIILSNWPTEGISVLKKTFPDIFTYSDIQIFSGIEHEMKPGPKLFEKCRSLCPYENLWLFIDDQKENLIAGSFFGIKGVLPDEAESLLKQHNII